MKNAMWFILGVIVALTIVLVANNTHRVERMVCSNGEEIILSIDGERVESEEDTDEDFDVYVGTFEG